jgi:hypothetical protein
MLRKLVENAGDFVIVADSSSELDDHAARLEELCGLTVHRREGAGGRPYLYAHGRTGGRPAAAPYMAADSSRARLAAEDVLIPYLDKLGIRWAHGIRLLETGELKAEAPVELEAAAR